MPSLCSAHYCSLSLSTNETGVTVAQFAIASDASPGSVSRVVVTATSQLDLTFNSIIVDLFVLSPDTDDDAPTCTILTTDYGLCANSTAVTTDNCQRRQWGFTGEAVDLESGKRGGGGEKKEQTKGIPDQHAARNTEHMVTPYGRCSARWQNPNLCPTTNGGIQNGSSVGIQTHCIHVIAPLAAIWMLSRCL